MFWKTIRIWIWTSLVVGLLLVAGIAATKDRVYTGTDIEFRTNRDLQIDTETAKFEAASSEVFVFYKEGGEVGETIVGDPAQPPLGWSSTTYFVAGPKEISGGKWSHLGGEATVRITAEKAVTVAAVQKDPGVIWIGFSVLAALVYLFGISLDALLNP